MVFDHIYAAVKIARTGKIISSPYPNMPNFQRKDEWRRYHSPVEETLLGHRYCGCTWAGAVLTIIKEIHPHQQNVYGWAC